MTTEATRHEPNSKRTKNVSDINAALQGASLAFEKSAIKSKTQANEHSSDNEALAAATIAERAASSNLDTLSTSNTGFPIPDHHEQARWIGAGVGRDGFEHFSEHSIVHRRLNQTAGAENGYLQLPQHQTNNSRSTSQIAASLAASRSAPTSPQLTGLPPSPSLFVDQRHGNSVQSRSYRQRATSTDRPVELLDTTPIPPTSSLVGMFEKSIAPKTSSPKRPTPMMVSKGPAPQIQSPKPKKPSTLLLKEEEPSAAAPKVDRSSPIRASTADSTHPQLKLPGKRLSPPIMVSKGPVPQLHLNKPKQASTSSLKEKDPVKPQPKVEISPPVRAPTGQPQLVLPRGKRATPIMAPKGPAPQTHPTSPKKVQTSLIKEKEPAAVVNVQLQVKRSSPIRAPTGEPSKPPLELPRDKRAAPIMASKGPTPQIRSPKPENSSTSLVKEKEPATTVNIQRQITRSSPIRASTGKSTQHPLELSAKDVDSDSSDESFVSATDHQPSPPPQQRRRSASISRAQQSAADDAATIEAMANAIIASSLATSRATSPTKSLSRSSADSNRPNRPNPPPRRRTPSIFHLHHHHHHNNPQLHNARSPSPVKGMRTTMRKPLKDSEEEDLQAHHTKRKIIKKHPNKHHEGDRKRWRDTVTERERKRYEAVWASNKGLFLSGEVPAAVTEESQSVTSIPGVSRSTVNPADCVCNIVVRDIWSRSRLGSDILHEVWELVDRSGRGYLSREEFVAGLWLIDQRLKGRKLPVRVGESVWASLGGLGGVKVRGGKKAR